MYKKLKQYILIIAVVFAAGFFFVRSSSSEDFKIVKNLDLFFSAFRELKLFYVDTIDADKVVKSGIDGMLGDLDPYTDFLSGEDMEDFDLATTGEYSGIGALVGAKDGYIQISETYRGFPADKAGLVAGDLILAIDGVSLKEKTTQDASNMLKGAQGTPLTMKVLKIRNADTIDVSLTREKIHISGIPYFGMLDDNKTGYISINSFTQNCQKDFRNALKTLKSSGNMKNLIIDLRGNTGGLLDAAVDIVGMFVPRGTEVLSARGRIKEFNYVYKTSDEPIDTQIPIIVLVNSMSASASEIVAGSLQDMDRAVIVGTRTFGKGLVQTVRPLGYNTKIKITTAKYYIPSGRCIQAHNFSKRNEDGSVATVPDSLKKEFSTAHGRKVFDGGGITPDIYIAPETYSNIAFSLLYRNLISEYSIKYYSKHKEIAAPENFSITDADYDDFVKFLSTKEFDYETEAEQLSKKLVAITQKARYSDSVKNETEKVAKMLAHDKYSDLQTYKDEIKELINQEIVARYYYQSGRIKTMLHTDNEIKEALKIFSENNKYYDILQLNK